MASGVKLDYETKKSYMVTVKATDPDSLSESINVTIKVNDMDEMPMVTGDAEKDYQENGTRMVARYTADDPGGPDDLLVAAGYASHARSYSGRH